MAAHNQWGRTGEELAAEYLKAKGYCICHRNWRAEKQELDIVARKGDELVVVEVKTRTDSRFGRPEEAVTPQKIRHIVMATDAYLREFELDLEVRFDIITVTGNEHNYRIEHIPDAFLPPVW